MLLGAIGLGLLLFLFAHSRDAVDDFARQRLRLSRLSSSYSLIREMRSMTQRLYSSGEIQSFLFAHSRDAVDDYRNSGDKKGDVVDVSIRSFARCGR